MLLKEVLQNSLNYNCILNRAISMFIEGKYGETHRQENKSHSTEHEEFKTHSRLFISHLIEVVVVLFI